MPTDAPAAFFSYAHEDLEFALRLAKDLKTAGAKVWMDKLDIRPGQRWEQKAEEALYNCARLLVILSPASVSSRNVMAEVAFALDEQKEVIPVLYSECRIPFRLRPHQYVDFRTDYPQGLEQLLNTVGVEQEVAVSSAAASAAGKESQFQGRLPAERWETSVSDPWAAATWFHKAVRDGDATCERALCRLVALYVQGALTVIRTRLDPEGSEMFALTSERRPRDEGGYKGFFEQRVVGAFSRDVPFWTMPAFLPNLEALNPTGGKVAVNILVEEQSRCGPIYKPNFTASDSAGMPCSASFTCRESVHPCEWRWAIGVDVNDWRGFCAAVNETPILRQNLDIVEGTLRVGDDYTCAIKGVQLNARILPHDGIFVGEQNGVQVYQIELSASGESVFERRLASGPSDQPRAVPDGQISVVAGNIISTLLARSSTGSKRTGAKTPGRLGELGYSED